MTILVLLSTINLLNEVKDVFDVLLSSGYILLGIFSQNTIFQSFLK